MLDVCPSCLGLGILMLMASVAAAAQSNGIPGPDEYTNFAKFITDRNIFDPNRQPHNYDPNRPRRTYSNRSRGTPAIQLVGTMSYEKGMFAFFNGSHGDLSQVAQPGNKVAGYTVTKITNSKVVLESTNKQDLALNVGDGLREEGGKWVPSNASELPVADTASGTTTAAGSESNSSPSTPPPSTLEQNDVLKRLMQLREKENQ